MTLEITATTHIEMHKAKARNIKISENDVTATIVCPRGAFKGTLEDITAAVSKAFEAVVVIEGGISIEVKDDGKSPGQMELKDGMVQEPGS